MTKIFALVVAVVIPLAVGAVGSVFTSDAVREWYPTLVQPSFAPPTWVFAPVWTALYVMMGVASWLIWQQGGARPAVRSALVLFAAQLAFNLAWSLLFFGLRQPFLALLDIVILLTLIVATTIRFSALSRGAALLMTPYIAWVAFATALNFGYWWLNRSS